MENLLEKTQKELDLDLLREVITNVVTIRDSTRRAVDKTITKNEKQKLSNNANKTIRENVLKVTTSLKERVPEYLREKVLQYFDFENENSYYKEHLSDPNKKESILSYVYNQIIGNMAIGVPSLDNLVKFSKQEREDLLNSWKPFFKAASPLHPRSFLLDWPLPERSNPFKTVEFSKENPTIVGSILEFIDDVPGSIKLTIRYLGIARMNNWDAHVRGFEIIGDSIFVNDDFQNETIVTVKDLKEFLADKNHSQRLFIKTREINSVNFRYMDYYENDRVEITFY